jgi:hypothetical protein
MATGPAIRFRCAHKQLPSIVHEAEMTVNWFIVTSLNVISAFAPTSGHPNLTKAKTQAYGS